MLSRGLTHVYLDLRSLHSSRRNPQPLPDDCGKLSGVRDRHHAGSGAGRSGRALLVRRRVDGRVGPVDAGEPVRGGRSLLHGPPWREPAREHLAAGGVGLGPPRSRGHRVPARAQSPAGAGRHSAEDIPAWQDTATESPDPALIQQDMSAIKHIMWNYVGLIRTTAAAQPRAERATASRRGDPALLPAQQADRRVDRPAPRRAHGAASWRKPPGRTSRSMGAHYRE